MDATPSANEIMQIPNVVGYLRCTEAGDIIDQQGTDAEALSGVIVYFQQIANLIGDSFGLENLQEAQIQAKSLNVICLSDNTDLIGVILNTRARLNEASGQIRKTLKLT